MLRHILLVYFHFLDILLIDNCDFYHRLKLYKIKTCNWWRIGMSNPILSYLQYTKIAGSLEIHFVPGADYVFVPSPSEVTTIWVSLLFPIFYDPLYCYCTIWVVLSFYTINGILSYEINFCWVLYFEIHVFESMRLCMFYRQGHTTVGF